MYQDRWFRWWLGTDAHIVTFMYMKLVIHVIMGKFWKLHPLYLLCEFLFLQSYATELLLCLKFGGFDRQTSQKLSWFYVEWKSIISSKTVSSSFELFQLKASNFSTRTFILVHSNSVSQSFQLMFFNFSHWNNLWHNSVF